MIDVNLVRDQFGLFDAETRKLLCESLENDLRTLSRELCAAWEAGDSDAISRARHSLKGVCGNFGARALLDQCTLALDNPAARSRLVECCETTLTEIFVVANRAG